MNTARILAVANMIEQHTIPWLGFNMGPFFSPANSRDEGEAIPDRSGHNCGTVACIAGHAIVLKHNLTVEPINVDDADIEMHNDFIANAAKFLGFAPGEERAHDLFFADTSREYRDNITAAQAVRTLRNLAETGTVDWTV